MSGTLRLSELQGERPGLLQQRSAVLASPGLDGAEHDESRAADDRLGVDRPSNLALGLVPPAERQVHHAPSQLEVSAETVELGVFRQLDGVLEDAVCLGEPKDIDEVPDDVDVRAAGVLGLAGIKGHRKAHLQHGLTLGRAAVP
jgi:hypothetical protein